VPELLPGQCLERSKRERINPLSTGYYMPTGHGQVSIAEFMAHWLPLRYSCSPIAVPRKHDEKWLCPQEKAALHGNRAPELENCSKMGLPAGAINEEPCAADEVYV